MQREVQRTPEAISQLTQMLQFTAPYYPPTGPIAQSLFLPDEIINPHTRFGYGGSPCPARAAPLAVLQCPDAHQLVSTLTANIRKRRGSNVEIQVPLFEDEHTDVRA